MVELVVFLIFMGAIAFAVMKVPIIDPDWKIMIHIVLGLYTLYWVLAHLKLVSPNLLSIH